MGMWVGRGRKARVAYGFDDIALVPGTVTVNPNEVDVAWELCGRRIELPIIAAAMDGVTDSRFAIEMGRLGGLAVLNLEGIQTRYETPDEVIEQIISSSAEEATRIIQSIYGEPIKEDLVHRRVSEIKKGGATVIVSAIPQRAMRFAKIAEEAGADFFVVQSTVIDGPTHRHRVRAPRLPAPEAGALHPGHRRQLRHLRGGARAHGDRASTRCSSGSGRAPRAPRARSSASACRRSPPPRTRRPRATSTTSRPAATCRSSPTAACPPAATSARRSPRRRRGHDRLGVRARRGSAGPRLPLGHGDAAREPAPRHADPRRRGRPAGADPLRARVHRRRHAEPGRRPPHLHGLGRRPDDPRDPA